jgi:hypothetical protein
MREANDRFRWRDAARRLAVDPEVARARAHRLDQVIRPDFRKAVLAGVGALVALSAGGTLGGLYAHSTQTKTVVVGLAVAFVLLAVLATRSAGNEVARIVSARAGGSAAATVRLIILLLGYLLTLIAVLGLLQVPLGHLLVGGAVTGVVVGIAAQQSLGHVFAGLVILMSRPFMIGDDIAVRSGSLGGPFEGTVVGMGLLYTTLATDEGHVHLPNAGLLASAVGPRPSAAGSQTRWTSPADGQAQSASPESAFPSGDDTFPFEPADLETTGGRRTHDNGWS